MTLRDFRVHCLVSAILAIAIAGFATTASAAEIGYVEDFALAPDRSVALKQLIPGTEDYYYYHCLHLQNTQQFDKVEELLQAWVKRHNYTARVNEILNRQALLTYEKHPEQSLKRLRDQLGLRFEHQRERLDPKPDLPTRLDPDRISSKTLTQRALMQYSNLSGFEPAGLESLATDQLNPERRRHLLSILARPDFPNLVKLVIDDLNSRDSGGFGSLGIHNQLLHTQLDECLAQKPELLNQQPFVNAYLTRLRPPVEMDWQDHPKELAAHLDRLWAFVSKLGSVHNSLKANVLYQRLALDRSQGVFDEGRFMAYLKLPRQVFYIQPKLMALEESRRYPCDLGANFLGLTLLLPVMNDEPLVRSYLMHFLVDSAGYKQFSPYIEDEYLKQLYAETKIVNGVGDAEQWYSLLPPDKYQQLRQRVDLDFAETNKTRFALDAPVSVDLSIKNVNTLIIKVFEINTTNFYRQRLREINTDVDLDGLIANEERSVTYTEPPLRRVQRHFEFPTLNKRGVYVIDFIGNGKSSRALIRKGKLRHLVRTSSAGHVFTILDENNQRLPEATLWLAGSEYKPDKQGQITVPFSTNPLRQQIVLSHGGFSSLDSFDHESENYSLVAGIYVDRESLLSGKTAKAVLRPSLRVNGLPAALSLLEEVTLRVTSTDLDGVATSKTVPDFKLDEQRESVFEFNVPPRLAAISFALQAKVQNLSLNKKIDLAVQESFTLNGIDMTDKVEDLHFSNVGGQFVIDLLGKSGEPRPDRPVQLSLKHRHYRETIDLSLKTDAQGRIMLGRLTNIATVTATGPQGLSHAWQLLHDSNTHYSEIHAAAGETIRVPYSTRQERPARSELSLLELRGDAFAADRFAALSLKDGLLLIEGLGEGNYDLLLKAADTRIHLRVAAGERREGYVLGKEQFLEVRGRRPLAIAQIEAGQESLTIQLENVTDSARVHVFATRYEPAYPPFAYFAAVSDVEPLTRLLSNDPSAYMGGRSLGDEYRYIIDRKHAKKFPGNMLARPELLLNPWAVRTTETGQQEPLVGEAFGVRALRDSLWARHGGYSVAKPTYTAASANLDFLDGPSAVLLNLRPDKNGVVTVDRKLIGPHQLIQVVAVDRLTTSYRRLSLPEVKQKPQDLRLATGLDVEKHFTQQKQISVVAQGEKFKVADILSSRFEVYDSLPRVYSLYATLSPNEKLAEFSFVLNWKQLKPAERGVLYSKYACHELNFFLMKKDPKFFAAVVKPYLANKKDKTFLDHWLMGDDVKAYLKPWNYGRLNVVERILLAQRIEGEAPRTSRHVSDLFDLTPPNVENFMRLFQTALGGQGLDTDDKLGLKGAVERQGKALKDREMAQSKEKRATREMSKSLDSRVQFAVPAPAAAEMPADATAALPAPPMTAMPSAPGANREAVEHLEKAQSQLEQRAESGETMRLEESYKADEGRRKEIRQLFRQLDATQEWAENNYYQLPIQQQTAELVTVNAFWTDYAAHDPTKPFYSSHLAEASRNFTEIMFALSVLDLPGESAKHETKFDAGAMTLTAGSPLVVFHQQVLPNDKMAEKAPILVSENFFRADDRYRFEANRRQDKYVTGEFLTHVVYGCQVVVTNPTSAPRTLEVLLQIPVGAMPVMNGQPLRTITVALDPYQTRSLEYFFYFPATGQFAHYPVQVSQEEQLLVSTKPVTLNVVNRLSQIDRESWDYLSQHGAEADVIRYLRANNLERTNLERIAWRMRDAAFFRQVIALLTARHVYQQTLWSYAVFHSDVPAIREYLQHADSFVAQCGPVLNSPLLVIDPVARRTYEHLEYRPLVNPRAHQLGQRRQILNDRFRQQYEQLLAILCYRSALTDDDLMAVTYYMLLQDRVEEALGYFQRVKAEKLATRLQYDYFTAYLDFSTGRTAEAATIAARYKEHPVDRWRKAFAEVSVQASEKDGGAAVVDAEDRNQQQTNLAATAAVFDFKIDGRQVVLNYQNLESVEVRYYRLDIEVLFSNNPFVQAQQGEFSFIRPNLTRTIKLKREGKTERFEVPAELRNDNVLIEISGGGQTRTQAHYANSLAVQVSETYGQVRVTQAETAQPLSTVYVKVYARLNNGQVRFYKDGYTDHRGRFDYSSLNTNDLDSVQKFAILVLSDQFGAVVREADPPKR